MTFKKSLAASVSMLTVLAVSAPAFAQTDLTALYEAAKAEGQLTTIALPHDWCGYGAVIEGFKAKYPGITINELNPDAGSADEIEAIKANKGNTGPQAPDVIDVGLAFGPQAKADGLIQPYKVSTWDSIPADAKGTVRKAKAAPEKAATDKAATDKADAPKSTDSDGNEEKAAPRRNRTRRRTRAGASTDAPTSTTAGATTAPPSAPAATAAENSDEDGAAKPRRRRRRRPAASATAGAAE